MATFASKQVLQNLCLVSKQACDVMTPMVVEFYNAINGETSKLKADKSVFTIADGIVQHLLVNSLFGDKFHDVVGEEEDSSVNITTKPYTVEDLTVPVEFYQTIDTARARMAELSTQLSGHDYKKVCVFIDPIDGTREFSTNLGEQCSICIGFSSSETGRPVAGIVYRPITQPPTWAAGAVSEGYADGLLNNAVSAAVSSSSAAATGTPATGARGLLTSNGGVSPFLVQLMTEMNCPRVPSGGAGNKMLMLLEGKGSAYIQDRGVSRWDTCAAQAVIEAYGGICTKLSHFADAEMQLSSYTYLKSELNLDYDPSAIVAAAGESSLASLTPYNVKNKAVIVKGTKQPATDVAVVKPYSNLCGLLALDKATASSPEAMRAVYDAITRARVVAQPAYD